MAAVASPVIFIKNIKKSILQENNLTSRKITIFNVLEYTFIQCAVLCD
jgi:hypothetical protein